MSVGAIAAVLTPVKDEPDVEPVEASIVDLRPPASTTSSALSGRWEVEFDAPAVRLGVAVVRGLLVDVLGGGSLEGATEALERHLATLPGEAAVPDQRNGTKR